MITYFVFAVLLAQVGALSCPRIWTTIVQVSDQRTPIPSPEYRVDRVARSPNRNFSKTLQDARR
jgi:hypothetical protein